MSTFSLDFLTQFVFAVTRLKNHLNSRLKGNAERLLNELELGQWILDKGLELKKRYSKVGVPSKSLLESKLVLVQLYQVSLSASLFKILSSKCNSGTRSFKMNVAPCLRSLINAYTERNY